MRLDEVKAIPDPESKLARAKDFEQESLSLEEIEALHALVKSSKKNWLKQILSAQDELLAIRKH